MGTELGSARINGALGSARDLALIAAQRQGRTGSRSQPRIIVEGFGSHQWIHVGGCPGLEGRERRTEQAPKEQATQKRQQTTARFGHGRSSLSRT